MWIDQDGCHWCYYNLSEGEKLSKENVLISILSYLDLEGSDEIFYDITFHAGDKIETYEYSKIKRCKSLEEAKFKGLVYMKNLGYDISINNYGDK